MLSGRNDRYRIVVRQQRTALHAHHSLSPWFATRCATAFRRCAGVTISLPGDPSSYIAEHDVSKHALELGVLVLQHLQTRPCGRTWLSICRCWRRPRHAYDKGQQPEPRLLILQDRDVLLLAELATLHVLVLSIRPERTSSCIKSEGQRHCRGSSRRRMTTQCQALLLDILNP